jgi:predicted small secreted protein
MDRRSLEGAKTMVRKILTLLLISGSVMVSACNTVDGAGRDVESVGDTVANTVN